MIEYVIGFTVIFALCCAGEFVVDTVSKRKDGNDIVYQEIMAMKSLYPYELYPELWEKTEAWDCPFCALSAEEFRKVVEARKVRFGTQISEPPLPPT